MSKISNSILKGAKEALDYAVGEMKNEVRETRVEIPNSIDVHAIREKLHLSRQEFCDSFGFRKRTLEKWEQGARIPEGAARAYLKVIDINPKMVQDALMKNDQNNMNSA